LIATHLFATFHVTRLLEAGQSLGTLDQTFYNRCTAAVTTAIDGSEPFDLQGLADPRHAKHDSKAGQQFSDLNTSLVDFNAALPAGHQRPNRSPVLKTVSLLCAVNYEFTVEANKMTMLTLNVFIQVLNEASQLAATNLSNHVLVNIFNRTRRWLAYKICSWQHPYINGLPKARVQSWLTLLLRASTSADNQASVLQLLPRFTSLEQPLQDVLSYLQSLVVEVHQHMGPRPVTNKRVFQHPENYMPWLYKILADLCSAQEHLLTQHEDLQQQLGNNPAQQQQQQLQTQLKLIEQQLGQIKLFTLLPQKSNAQQFITISTSCLHR